MIELEAFTSLMDNPEADMLNNKNLLWCSIKLLKIQMVNVSVLKDLNIHYMPSTFVFSSHLTKMLSFP